MKKCKHILVLAYFALICLTPLKSESGLFFHNHCKSYLQKRDFLKWILYMFALILCLYSVKLSLFGQTVKCRCETRGLSVCNQKTALILYDEEVMNLETCNMP